VSCCLWVSSVATLFPAQCWAVVTPYPPMAWGALSTQQQQPPLWVGSARFRAVEVSAPPHRLTHTAVSLPRCEPLGGFHAKAIMRILCFVCSYTADWFVCSVFLEDYMQPHQ
jgi:hypothetical protein